MVWARDPKATTWAGNWKQKADQWWLDENTDQARVDALLDATLTRLAGAAGSEEAWRKIFEHYNRQARALALYRSFGFVEIPAYGEYVDSPATSVCLAKEL